MHFYHVCLLCIQKKKKWNFLNKIVQNPFQHWSPILHFTTCPQSCQSLLFHTMSPCVSSEDAFLHQLLSHYPCLQVLVLEPSYQMAWTVNYQSRPLPQWSLPGLLADRVTVQWSSPSTSSLGGRVRDTHPDFKDGKVCITTLYRISAIQ